MCRSRYFGRLPLVALVTLLLAGTQTGAQSSVEPAPASSIAFVNVNVVPMDRERVLPAQTVQIRGDRIIVIAATADTQLPADALVVDGTGLYLLPGLIDAHVHLQGDGTGGKGRADFGDAPLYLAHGVTTVFNMRGIPEHLSWRRRIESGELSGPSILTSGDFINEPRVTTSKEVRDEVMAQALQGYDLIKFHEIWSPGKGFTTTKGLTQPAYLAMNDAARSAGLPLIGHAPVNLGLDALLEAHQALAHVGTLSNLYFFPLAANLDWLLATAASIAILIVLLLIRVGAALRRRVRKQAPPQGSHSIARVDKLAAVALTTAVVAFICAVLSSPASPMSPSTALRVAFTSLMIVVALATAMLCVAAMRLWRTPGQTLLMRSHASILSVASLTVVVATCVCWIPIAWRSTPDGIEQLAQRLSKAGIWVQTTLINYDSMNAASRFELLQDPNMKYVAADTQARWRRAASRTPRVDAYVTFQKRVTGALHRAGVPLMAGTDAMGLPLVGAGSSLHRELRLLVESGLTPYEALRAATVNPARFVGKQDEFGTIAVGQRADLVLVSGNPLENLSVLHDPVGVAVRGKWMPREELHQRLVALSTE